MPLPCGYPVIRCEEHDFKPEKPHFAVECADWLSWISHSENITIQQGLMSGEKWIQKGRKKAKVDGYCETNKTAYEFKGFWWHMHDCMVFTRYEGARHPQQEMTAAVVEEQDHQRKT